ncbi:MAG: ribosomal protein S18-alanine N-acetyltransferase [Candidatus Puniceispirillaceae bacterium]
MIRAIRTADCDTITAIEAQTFNTALDRGRLLNFMKMRAFCGFVDDANIPDVPNDEGELNNMYQPSKLAGYLLATIIVDEAEILSFAVSADYQKCGCGAGLLRHFLTYTAQKSVKSVLLEVAADNVSALTLYHRLGFNEFGRRPHYFKRSDGDCDAIMMRRLSD